MIIAASFDPNHHRCLGYPKMVRRNRITVGTILRELGVPCLHRAPFFVVNEARLEWIYYDFQKAARKALAKAHPDKGGDTENFQNMLEKVQMVHRSFGRAGIGPERHAKVVHRCNTREWNRIYARKHNARWKEAIAMYYILQRAMRKDGALPPPSQKRQKRAA